jgi:2-dehydro-3-deoxy-D-pentonate aldolase
VDGISTLGSTGEFSHLDGNERRRFAEAVVEMVEARVPVIVGVGTAGTREAVDLARHAENIGANGILSVSPYYWKVGEEALFKHFVTVAESLEIPTLVYNFPMLTGIDLSPSLLARLARECPSIVGVKDTVKEFSSYYARADVPCAA